MGTVYTIDVHVTPLCTSCGKELEVCGTESRPSSYPFEKDNPYERTHRRVFVRACPDCYTFTGGGSTATPAKGEGNG